MARVVEFAEAAACADMMHAAPHDFRCVGETAAGGWLLEAPSIDMLLFNRVLGCGLTAPVARDSLITLVARLRSSGHQNFGVQVSPSALPPEVPEWLAAEGLLPRDRWTKVIRDAEPATPVRTELRIEPVERRDASVFATVAISGFGMPVEWQPWLAALVGRPQWHTYVAYAGSEPVGAAALYVHRDVGWLGVASTLPAARRRGAQGALMARRIEDGRALGCRWFVTETGEETSERPNPSFRNMLRAGFQVAYHRQNYMPPKVEVGAVRSPARASAF